MGLSTMANQFEELKKRHRRLKKLYLIAKLTLMIEREAHDNLILRHNALSTELKILKSKTTPKVVSDH